MAVLFSATLLLLMTSQVSASEHTIGRRWALAPSCTTDPKLSSEVNSVLHPTQTNSFDASSFCSAYLQPISETYTTSFSTQLTTLTQVIHTTVDGTVTTTDLATGTTTELCPTPSPSQICGKLTGGRVHPQIDYTVTDPQSCQQRCLNNAQCKSFQIITDNDGFMECTLYNEPVTGATATYDPLPYGYPTGYFYDSGCADHLPEGCASAAAPTVTAAPSLAHAAGLGRDRVPYSYSYTYPDFLGYVQYSMEFICSCIVTSALPTATVTISYTDWVFPQSDVTQYTTYSVTEHPNYNTVYSTLT